MSADDAIDEDEGSSATVGTTFGSVRGGTMLASDLAYVAFVDYAMSSRRTSTATVERRASITHCMVTCSATTYVCGSKLSPSVWISSTLHPSTYPL